MVNTLPWSYYSDPGILRRERERLFARSWQYVGHSGALDGPGSYFPSQVGALPVVVTQDAGGRLHALVNICRHRGTVVCSEAGKRETLICPYHAWRYELDGSLRSAPRSDREVDFDAAAHRLPALSVERWGPFIFAAGPEHHMSLAEVLGELPDRVEAAGVDVDALEFHSRWDATLNANWKVVVENYLECYHCRVAHPEFSRAIDTSPDAYRLETSPTFSSQHGPVRPGWEGPFDANGPVARGEFHLLYPNTIITIMPGQPNLSIGPVNPAGPAATVRFLDYFFGVGVESSWIEGMLEFDAQVGREDLALVEAAQRGLEAEPGGRGRLFVDSEQLIADFDTMVLAALE